MTQVICDAVLGAALSLRHCSQASYNRAETAERVRQSGLPDSVDVDVTEVNSTFEWTTTDIAGLTGGVSLRTGLLIPDTDASGIVLSSRARSGASMAGGSSEGQFKMESGLIVPTQISVSERQTATATLMAYARSVAGDTEPAGVLDPVSYQTGTAPTAGTATRYALGKIQLNAGTLTTLTRGVSVTITPGLQVTPRRDNGFPYADDFEIEVIDATVELTFQSKSQLDSILGAGSKEFSALSVELWPRGNAGALDPDNAITFSFGAGYAERTTESGSGTSPIQPTLTCHGTSALSVA